ncbi:unnamed protein product [Lampetra planeri]
MGKTRAESSLVERAMQGRALVVPITEVVYLTALPPELGRQRWAGGHRGDTGGDLCPRGPDLSWPRVASRAKSSQFAVPRSGERRRNNHGDGSRPLRVPEVPRSGGRVAALHSAAFGERIICAPLRLRSGHMS